MFFKPLNGNPFWSADPRDRARAAREVRGLHSRRGFHSEVYKAHYIPTPRFITYLQADLKNVFSPDFLIKKRTTI